MLVTAFAKEKQSGGTRLHHSERGTFHRQRGDQKSLPIAVADLSVLGFKAHFDHALSIGRLIADHHAVYVGRRKVVPCIVDGDRHSRKFLDEPLEEPGFIARACTQVGEPDRVLASLPAMTP
jgi:hypothetical protein